MLNGRGTASWCTIEPISYSRISTEYQHITRRDAQHAGQAEGQEGRRLKWNKRSIALLSAQGVAVCQDSRRENPASAHRPSKLQAGFLKILEPGNELPQEVVDQFRKTRMQANKAQVACFCELKSSNVGKIVEREDRTIAIRGE